jgi:hypothetical protein
MDATAGHDATPGQDATAGMDATAGNMDATAGNRDATAMNPDALPGQDAVAALDAQPGADVDNTSFDASNGDAGPSPGVCIPNPEQTGNSMNIGAYCTKAGHQCSMYNHGPTFVCAADVSMRGGNFCIKIGCGSMSDCGEAACCYHDPSAPLIGACLPQQCVQTDAGVCPM